MKTLTSFLVFLVNIAYVFSGAVYKVNVGSGSHLNIRSGPSTGDKIVGQLNNGDFIYAISVNNGWVKYYRGYVSRDYVTGPSGGSTVTTNSNLNFREGPATKYSKIVTLNKGTSVTYYGKDQTDSVWAVTNQGYAHTDYLNLGGGSSSSSVLKKAEVAADYARQHAHPKSQGWCAKYVANALEYAGFKFTRQGSACFYHTKGILKGMGFTNISKPGSFKKGDIAVHGCNSAHEYGHIQIYDGSGWYSDFKQKSTNVYSSNSPPLYYYRA